jgi:hypothetical protein
MSLLPDLNKYFTPEIVATFAEVHQPRSRFQLEHFVVLSHATPEMQYYQIITEIQALYYTIKQVSLELQKTQIEIDRLRLTGDAVDELDAQIKELNIEQTKVVGVGALRELEILLELKNRYPEYKRNEIEDNQGKYWELRLEQQTIDPNQQAINQTKQGLRQIK